MLRRRPTPHAASHDDRGSAFDRLTFHAFMLAVTVTAAVMLGYGPAAALRHIGDVLAAAGELPLPDATAWSGQMVF